MKNKNIFMMIILSAICVLFGMSNANALVYDTNNIDLSGITSLSGYTSHYVVIGTYERDYINDVVNENNTSRVYILFADRDTIFYDIYSGDISGYYNSTCISQNACFTALYSTRSSGHNMYQYYSDDGGLNWTYLAYSNTFITSGAYTSHYTIKLNNLGSYTWSQPQSNVFDSGNYDLTFLPSYLQGYTKVTLTTNDRYYMLSDISSGSVFIPYNAFFEYGGLLSYYDNDLSSQPYSTYIQDYTIMSDSEYVRQDFNLENFPGADMVMFSKYVYLEGQDNISYDIYVPSSSYGSNVIITPNQQGGNDFTFDYKDSNGDIQQGVSSSVSSGNPLLPEFLQNFSTNTFGLTSIIVAPLNLITSLLSPTCSSISVPLPFINSSVSLPCMSTFYSNVLGNWYSTYQYITFGLVSYWVIIRIFNLIKDFKNPDHDEIEVLDV